MNYVVCSHFSTDNRSELAVARAGGCKIVKVGSMFIVYGLFIAMAAQIITLSSSLTITS